MPKRKRFLYAESLATLSRNNQIRLLKEGELMPYSNDEITALPALNLPTGSPNIFVSFSAADKGLAILLRDRFAEWGWQSWLFINQIQKGHKIFKEVASAVSDCKAAVILITATSIGSAWVYSEFETLVHMKKDVCAVFDATSKELCEVLANWERGDIYQNNYDPEKADALVKLYEQNTSGHHAEGFAYTTRIFLSALSLFTLLAVYPKRPAG